MNKLMILDGNSIVNRAFYGIRLLTNSEGLYTNAVYGFLNILFKYLEEEKPDGLSVAFDLSAPTFRHKQYDKYKANRKGMPEELRQQMPLLKEVLSAMNITMLSKEGYEADDIIGTVAKKCDSQNIKCVILTGDRDDLQLASDSTVIKLVTTKAGGTQTVDYDQKQFEAEYEITPQQFIDVKGLMGDSSDNIPGVAGIGEKTAFSLIKQFKSIDGIYENLEDKAIKPGVRQKLIDGKDDAVLSKQLATIDCCVPIDTDIASWGIKEYDKAVLFELFKRLNFQSFIKKLELTDVSKPEIASAEAGGIVEAILKAKTMYFYTDGEKYAVSMGEAIAEIEKEDFTRLLFDETIVKIGHNLKEVLVNFGIFQNIGFDTMIAAYLDNPGATDYSISAISLEQLGISEISDVTTGCYAVIGLHKAFAEKIEASGQRTLYYDIELPLVTVLADMQITGVLVNKEELVKFGKQLGDTITTLETEIYSLAGCEFNINSPKQLGVILFESLKLPVIKKTKTGYSTNAEVLDKLIDEHPIINLILEYRHIAKLKSTYTDGLAAVINKETGRIHSNFNQTVTVTGRISSTEPNLQNIPVRTALGRELRKMFVAPKGCVLCDADYSQIELRVLAHIADDSVMKEAFNNDRDIHTATAMQVFGVEREQVTSEMRSRAKTVNFGIVYGMGDFSLAKDLKIPVYEARNYIKSYFDRFSGVRKYMDEIVEKAKGDGFVTTILNRRRPIPELAANNFITRSFGERVAMNTPIQGSAADIIKLAMVKVYNRLKAEKLKSKLILQVHDELIIEAYDDERAQVEAILKTEMESAYRLNVPLKVDMNVGETWYDAK